MKWYKKIMLAAVVASLFGSFSVFAQGDDADSNMQSGEKEVTVETALDNDVWFFDITNNTDNNAQTNIITAFFSGNEFKGIKNSAQKIELLPNETKRCSVESPSDYSYDKVKVFLWDDLNNMKPVFNTDAVTVSKDALIPCSGWLIDVSVNDDGELVAKLFNTGGEVAEYSFADEITFASSHVYADRLAINTNEDKMKEMILSEFDYMSSNKISNTYPVHLVEYKLNSDNKIERLSMPELGNNDGYGPYVHNENIYGYMGNNIVLNKQFVFDGKVTKLIVPTDVNDIYGYKLTEVDMSDYGNYTVEANMAMAKYDSSRYNILIEYVKPTYVAESFTYGTATDSPYMMISDIQTVTDNKGNEVYKLSGYINGIFAEFTTTTTTSVSEVLSSQYDKSYYNVMPLWSASDIFTDSTGISDENKEKYPTIYDALSVGDIVGIQYSGKNANTIIKMVDIQDYISDGTMALSGGHMFSTARDMISTGKVVETKQYGEDCLVTLNSDYDTMYAYNSKYPVTVYDVETNTINPNCTVADLAVYDADTNCGDMVYLRKFAYNQREIFAIRFGGGSDTQTKQAALKNSEGNYGWVVNAEISEDNILTVKLLTADSDMIDYTFADAVTFWGPSEADEKIILDMTDDEAKNTVITAYETVSSNTYSQNLVRYKLNADNEIEELIMSYYTDDYENADPQRVVVYSRNMYYMMGDSNVLAGEFYINDGITKFVVPKTKEDTSAYEAGTVTASDYIDSQNGAPIEFFVAEISDNMPAVIIEYKAAENNSEELVYSTADDIPHMMISKIVETTDWSGNKVYEIRGYIGAGEVSYTTTPYTTVSEAKLQTRPKEYEVKKLWSAQDGEESTTTIYDVLGKGDIVGIGNGGITIIKMLDMQDYITDSTTVWGSYFAFSETRDGIAMGRVLAVETVGNSVVFVTEYGNVFSYDVYDSVMVYNAQTGEIEEENCSPMYIEEDDVVYLREFKHAKRELYVIKGMDSRE